jgi:transcriptional regulator with XRE-family HTH domain
LRVNNTGNTGIWPAYIEKVSGTTSRRDIARASGVSPSAISRWFTGDTQPTDAGNVAAIAIAYGRNPVEAFVAAGLLDLHDAAKGLTRSEVRLLESLSDHGPNLSAVAKHGRIVQRLINQYSPWEELASLPHIELRHEQIGDGRLGEYVHHLSLIRLDPRMCRRQARSVLCHELRHVEFEDVAVACSHVTARQERRADLHSSRLMINVHDLADALIVNGPQAVTPIAVDLRVSVDMVRNRLLHLHPSERHYITRRLEHEYA